MARYFFHIRGPQPVTDPFGKEFASEHEAVRWGCILLDSAIAIDTVSFSHMEVVDIDGNLVEVIRPKLPSNGRTN